MEQQEIQERNKQIALMMGWDDDNQTMFYPPHRFGSMKELDELCFHSDWNWLMETCDFIGNLRHKGFSINYVITKSGCAISINLTNVMGEKFEGKSEVVNTLNINYHIVEKEEQFTQIESVFIAVSDFAKLYNEKKL